ncbi:hypothetical protein [Pseudomonas oryzihabitans]|uniref:hypothetical protein n=1 Tax=Pseudomonas oryzihabitans TaxID=47885 RepID=UPI0028B17C54|nr:hypothetical protein [Pseudomonas oryzihabitans]
MTCEPRIPQTCECRYDEIGGHLIWCLGCREAEESRKLSPRPNRLRAWLTTRRADMAVQPHTLVDIQLREGTAFLYKGVKVTAGGNMRMTMREGDVIELRNRLGMSVRWKRWARRALYACAALGYFCLTAVTGHEAYTAALAGAYSLSVSLSAATLFWAGLVERAVYRLPNPYLSKHHR